MTPASFEGRNGRAREPNAARRRAAAVLAIACLAGACGGPAPTSPGSPSPGVTPFPPGDPASLAPYLVRDIRPGPDSSMSDAYAGQFFPFRGRVLFVADDGTHGLELWASDGTAEGTRLVADICPGSCSSNPTWFCPYGDEILFQATDEAHGQELWKTDGTALGTRLVKDIAPGPEDGINLLRSAVLDGVLYFPARRGASFPPELWRSDGTGPGTRSLGVLTPGFSLAASGGLVFFGAGQALGRLELWKTDGRGRGTALVSPIQPVTGTMVDWRGRLFLTAEDAQHGQELWTSDGSAEGTVLLADIAPGTAHSSPRGFFAHADELFFAAYDPAHGSELWRTDGTAGGTRLVADIQPGTGSGLSTSFRGGVGVGDRIFFTASDGASGEELWAYRPR